MSTAVVYYTQGGTTRSYARAEANARKAALVEVKPLRPYRMPMAFLRGCSAAIHQKSVPLAEPIPDLSAYTHIVLMAPLWAGFPAPPFNSMIPLLPTGCEVEVLLVSSSGNSAKSTAQVRQKIEAIGCVVTAQRDIRSHL